MGVPISSLPLADALTGAEQYPIVQNGTTKRTTLNASGVAYDPAGTDAVPTTVQSKLRESVSVEDFGAVGNGSTDDTLALQAAINYALSTSCRLKFAAKTYRITSPLIVGGTVPQENGSPMFEGVNASVINDRGTTIRLDGSGHTCIIEFRAGAAYGISMKGILLRCSVVPAGDVYAASYGIYFSQEAYSTLRFDDIRIQGPRYAIYAQNGGYGNGEFNTYRNVQAASVQKFFVLAAGSGQAYGHMFNSCGMWARAAGAGAQGSSEYVYFELGDGNGGYGLYVQDFNATITGTTSATSHRATYFKDNGANGPVYFSGGRVEGMTTLVENNTATSNSIVKFSDIDFAALYSTNANPMVVSNTASVGFVTFSHCQLPFGVNSKFVISLETQDRFQYKFERCGISNPYTASALEFDISHSRMPSSSIEFNECQVRRSANSQVEILNKAFSNAKETSPGLVAVEDNSIIQGVPSNLLQYPYFNGATPSSPWVASTPFTVYQNGGSNVTSFTGSPYGVYLQMPAGMTVYQDVYTVTAANQRIGYLAAVLAYSGNTSNKLVITLSNPTTGEVYEKVRIGQAAGNYPVTAPIVRLDASTTSASGTIRLTWEAPATNSGVTGVYLDWQTVSTNVQCGFVNTTNAAVAYSHPWGNVNNLRAFGRLSIPYIPRTAADLESLPNAESDLAISSQSKRLIYFANSHGNELPNQDVGSTAPLTGTWPQGWIRWNSAPAAGGTVGWVCTAAGTPGTWKTFGAISA